MGIVDDSKVVGSIVKPKEHIFVGEKAMWWGELTDDGLARHVGFNQPFQARLKAWYAEGCPKRTDIAHA